MNNKRNYDKFIKDSDSDDTYVDEYNSDDDEYNSDICDNKNKQKNKKKIINVINKANIYSICPNILCDHKKETKKSMINLDNIKTLDDLILLGQQYHCKNNIEYKGMSLRILCKLINPLNELKNMIGMNNVKDKLIYNILYFVRGMHIQKKCGICDNCYVKKECFINKNDMLHTVITGEPGIGKTELAKIIAKIYNALEILTTDKFKIVSRSDLIANYLGQTATKTQKVIDDITGGVLFIDEAYSLGNNELNDSYAKECIDTINLNLTENRNFLCIIAGYKNELEKCFFNYNEGLRRRFTFRYNLEKYSWNDLKKIFELKIKLSGFHLSYLNSSNTNTNSNKEIENLFETKYNCFPNNAGDIETLVLNCKIEYSKNLSNYATDGIKILSNKDILEGFNSYLVNREY
jgi:SpoVK/Ycf46/Vps4 family AAA+-type ATPase